MIPAERADLEIEQRVLEDLAQQAVRLALARGATDAECTIAQGDEFNVTVRMGQVESLKEAGSRGTGIRVLIGKRSGSSYTSDLSPDGIRRMVSAALEVAEITSEDPYTGLPDVSELGYIERDLELYHEDVAALSTEEKIARARQAEAAALDADARINNSEGASFDSYVGLRVFANSRGFVHSYRTSNCSLSAVPVAQQNGAMERDYWMTTARSAARLESPEYVGRRAAERVLRRLGARKIPTQKAPVIFEPRVARSLIDHVFDAVNGGAVYRGASFLAGKLGQKVAADHVTLIDDGTIPTLLGTSPCDDEGVPSRRSVVIENGVLSSYLLNTYSARRLGLRTTGNASRGLSGNTGVGHGTLYLEAGPAASEDIIRSVHQGLYVTELIGFGVNTVTGDYSRGAVGLWIENGEFAYPVSEVTIAGSLQEILLGIEAIGSDLEFRGALASPTLLIREMTISGR
ncbi:MAG TPA: metallopeptidase TldD-related protein [Bryobacteraceae bacterium]|nr:metallopeptidase TldD-related protein [Bryobacteraceae bacterium]